MSDSFFYRVFGGALVLSLFALWEWRVHRRTSRMREYLFLLSVALATVAYAIGHDVITYAMAPEYFSVLKNIAATTFFPGVAWLAAQAGWTAGLFVGLGLLIANNPGKRPQISYKALVGHVRFPIFWSLAAAIGGGLYAHYQEPTALQHYGLNDAAWVVTVWGVHIGSYVGALLGLGHGCFRVHHARRRGVLAYAPQATVVTM